MAAAVTYALYTYTINTISKFFKVSVCDLLIELWMEPYFNFLCNGANYEEKKKLFSRKKIKFPFFRYFVPR
jgi:hypothetical protein